MDESESNKVIAIFLIALALIELAASLLCVAHADSLVNDLAGVAFIVMVVMWVRGVSTGGVVVGLACLLTHWRKASRATQKMLALACVPHLLMGVSAWLFFV